MLVVFSLLVKIMLLGNTIVGKKVHLTLEQRRFELSRSTWRVLFFDRYSAVNVFSLRFSYHFLFSSILRGKKIVYNTYNIPNMCRLCYQ